MLRLAQFPLDGFPRPGRQRAIRKLFAERFQFVFLRIAQLLVNCANLLPQVIVLVVLLYGRAHFGLNIALQFHNLKFFT